MFLSSKSAMKPFIFFGISNAKDTKIASAPSPGRAGVAADDPGYYFTNSSINSYKPMTSVSSVTG